MLHAVFDFRSLLLGHRVQRPVAPVLVDLPAQLQPISSLPSLYFVAQEFELCDALEVKLAHKITLF